MDLLQELTGEGAIIERGPARPGDQKHTAANVEKAKSTAGLCTDNFRSGWAIGTGGVAEVPLMCSLPSTSNPQKKYGIGLLLRVAFLALNKAPLFSWRASVPASRLPAEPLRLAGTLALQF